MSYQSEILHSVIFFNRQEMKLEKTTSGGRIVQASTIDAAILQISKRELLRWRIQRASATSDQPVFLDLMEFSENLAKYWVAPPPIGRCPLWHIHTARKRDWDRYRELDQHNGKQWALVPVLSRTSMNNCHIRTHWSLPVLVSVPVPVPFPWSVNKPLRLMLDPPWYFSNVKSFQTLTECRFQC